MSTRSFQKLPAISRHKASGQAVVRLNGKDHYLGRFGTPEAEAEYNRLMALWIGNGRRIPEEKANLSINELMVAYWHHCEIHYRKPDGTPTSELDLVKHALKPLKNLFGFTEADRFGPSAVKTVRQVFIARKLCRTSINKHIGRIRLMFRWAVENELVAPSVYHGLMAVRGLQKGRSDAKESSPVRPVPESWIEAVRPFVASPVRAMIDLQLLTGMRPGETVIMRACNLDMRGPIWIYRPHAHKTEHHGHEREIYIGPKAQEIVRGFLKADLQAYLFAPTDARTEQFVRMRSKRKSKVQPSQICRKRSKAKRKPGTRYTVVSYRRAIGYACAKAFPLPINLAPTPDETKKSWRMLLTPEKKQEVRKWHREHAWHPHQLRHNSATRLRREHGIELTRIILGHTHLNVTEIYAEVDRVQAMEVVGKVG